MSLPTLPTPAILHVERDGYECYVTASDGLERICTMSRPGEAQRLTDAQMIVQAVNAHAALVAALQVMVDHAKERFPHFESERGQRDIEQAQAALKGVA